MLQFAPWFFNSQTFDMHWLWNSIHACFSKELIYYLLLLILGVQYDCTSSRTVDFVGNRSISVASTGHDKAMFTCLLTITAEGGKKVPCVIFRGKGSRLSEEDREMHKRRDIKCFYSDNGWNNQTVTNNWINYMFPTTTFSKKILIPI